ncbi:MAG: 8-oxo-dGTP diphosphatase [Ruminococcaceae bacterium]|nr:8-oxo-dGTP diphosphatase [Oscillospiraceae bacterium]
MRNSTLGYLEKDGCYLMLHRIKKEMDINKDKWIGIGGGMEDGESPEECMRREALEETGLALGRMDYRGIVTFWCTDEKGENPYGEYMHLFLCRDFSGEMRECDEGTLEWVPIEKVPLLPIWEGDKIFLRFLQEEVPFFSLKLVYRGDNLIQVIFNDDFYPIGS